MLLEWGIKGSSGWAEASPPWVRVRFLGQAGPYYAGQPRMARPIARPGAFETFTAPLAGWPLLRGAAPPGSSLSRAQSH